MTKLKGLLLSLSLILPLCSFSQVTDSLTEISVPKYVLWRIMHDISVGKTCDSLQRFQADAIENGLQVILVQDSLLSIKSAQIHNLEQASYLWERRYINQTDLTKSYQAEVKRWKLTTIIGGVLIVIITIL
jgi:hypothetical protein